MPPVRIGIIGAGWFASRRHCPDIVAHPEAMLTALCRRDAAQASKMAAEFAVEHTFTDYRDLIGSNRRYALALLNRFDSDGTTQRNGDVRVLR